MPTRPATAALGSTASSQSMETKYRLAASLDTATVVTLAAFGISRDQRMASGSSILASRRSLPSHRNALGVHSEHGEELSEAFARAGFRVNHPHRADFDGRVAGAVYWHDGEPRTWGKDLLRARLTDAEAAAVPWRSQLDESERRAADYVLVTQEGFPAYLGGLFAAGLS